MSWSMPLLILDPSVKVVKKNILWPVILINHEKIPHHVPVREQGDGGGGQGFTLTTCSTLQVK